MCVAVCCYRCLTLFMCSGCRNLRMKALSLFRVVLRNLVNRQLHQFQQAYIFQLFALLRVVAICHHHDDGTRHDPRRVGSGRVGLLRRPCGGVGLLRRLRRSPAVTLRSHSWCPLAGSFRWCSLLSCLLLLGSLCLCFLRWACFVCSHCAGLLALVCFLSARRAKRLWRIGLVFWQFACCACSYDGALVVFFAAVRFLLERST